MKKTITTDLFRFITLRSPQLIAKNRRKLGFVEHPAHSESFFLKEIIGEQNLDIARQKLLATAPGFTPFQSVEEIKQFAGSLWEFSMWLSKAKNELNDPHAISTAIQQVNDLGVVDSLKIWDNVFYDILTRQNEHVRQACLQLLVAIHFMKHYPDHLQDLKQIKRIANSRVVIPIAFSKKGISTEINTPQSTKSKAEENQALQLQSKKHEVLMAECQIRQLKGIKTEVLDLEERYTNEYANAYQKATQDYALKSEPIIQDYLKTNAQAEKRATSEADSTIPPGLIPPFTFTFPEALSKSYSSRKLSKMANAFIQTERLYDAPVSVCLNRLDEHIFQQQVIASQLIKQAPKKVQLSGVILQVQSSSLPTYTISTVLSNTAQGRELAVYFSFNAGYPNARFTSAQFEIQIGNTSLQTYHVNETELIYQPHTQSNTLFALLKVISFPGTSFRDDLLLSVTGKFELDEGQVVSFSSKKQFTHKEFSGIADLSLDTPEPSGVIHYGINKIGVADYRKVEQELCCYIPGEVSHIENIMAREYKEKATRHLLRSEESFESTTENEIEESNDTTTTTRHELSSEIAHVVTNDRSMNVGFDTGVSGSYAGVTMHANLNGDFSMAQSTSDSDSIARTYAEDVTKRALERVVQKTTIKRSSKILKEYEENNKHGYDNRNGEKHVTGVFRWIDKVYTNRLVNYGKRLIYEFMVPEPGRFYKDLIIIKAEETPGSGNTNTGPVLVEPTHPSVYGINGPSSIDRTNYQSFAVHYGVSPTIPMDETLTVVETYSKSITYDQLPWSNDIQFQNPIIIPGDYVCKQLQYHLPFTVHRPAVIDSWFISINASGNNLVQGNDIGELSMVRNFTRSNLSITNPINVSITVRWIKTFALALTATCQLKASVYQQWQQDVYDAIMAAYQQQMDAYHQALDDATNDDTVTPPEEDKTLITNPAYNKQFILSELKRLCIEMLLAPFGLPQGKDFYSVGNCDVPHLNLSPELDQYARQVKFFEQAYDWNILSYFFYPYYWAKPCDWKKLFQSQDSVDHVLQAFLQSGMARIMVPVREGFEDAVTYFMETGEIWQGTGLVLDTDDELYLSIVDEITYVDGKVEEEWDTVVPTTLTIIQGRSVYLDDAGLPCCEHDRGDKDENPIQPSDNTLTLYVDSEGK